MTLRVTITIRWIENVQATLRRVIGPAMTRVLQRGLNRTAREVATAAKHRVPYRSGKLRRGIFWQEGGDVSHAEAAVIVPPIDGVPYGLYQHEGTGVYGPRGSPIVPVNASVLRFQVPGMIRPTKTGKYRRGPSQVVFARQVKGVPPNPFLMDAFQSAVAIGLVQKEIAASFNDAVQGGGVDIGPSDQGGE